MKSSTSKEMTSAPKKRSTLRLIRQTPLRYLLVAMIFSLALLYLSTNSVIEEKGAEIRQLNEEIASLSAENKELALEEATLTTPSHMEAAARELGMVSCGEDNRIFYLAKDDGGESASEKKEDPLTEEDTSLRQQLYEALSSAEKNR